MTAEHVPGAPRQRPPGARDGCCASWPRPCPYHEGWQDAEDALAGERPAARPSAGPWLVALALAVLALAVLVAWLLARHRRRREEAPSAAPASDVAPRATSSVVVAPDATSAATGVVRHVPGHAKGVVPDTLTSWSQGISHYLRWWYAGGALKRAPEVHEHPEG